MGRRRRVKLKALAVLRPRQTRDTSLSEAIKLRIARYYVQKMRACFFELGLCGGGRLRADIFVLAMNGHTVIVEVKSSLADFRADKKMHLYEPYACQAYCAMPGSVYLKVKDKILTGWGVFVMSENGHAIQEVKRATNYDLAPGVVNDLWVRAVFRSADTNGSKSKVPKVL